MSEEEQGAVFGSRFKITDRAPHGYNIIDTDEGADTPVCFCATYADACFVSRLMNAGNLFRDEIKSKYRLEQELLAKEGE